MFRRRAQKGLDVGSRADAIPFRPQQALDRPHAGRRIEADGIAGATATRRIVRHHQRNLSFGARRPRQARPGGSEARYIVDTAGLGRMAHTGEFDARIGRRLRLEGDGAGQQAAVEFRQDDVHGEIGRRQPARRCGPGLLRTARQHDLKHRHVGTIEHCRVVGAHRRESRGVEDDRRLARCDQPRESGLDGGILEAADRYSDGGEALGVERFHQSGDRRDVGRHQVGAIEDDECGRPCILRRAQHRDRPHRYRRRPDGVALQQAAGKAQRLAQVLGAALAEELVEPGQRLSGQGRDRGKPRIGAVVARQGGEEQPLVARHVADALEAVAPIVEPAQAAHDHQLGAGHDAVDIEVDRHRMLELLQAGEPQRRQRLGILLPRRSQCRQIAVGKGQHDDIGRRLAKVDGDIGLVEGRKLGRQNVHGPSRAAPRGWRPCRSPSRR